MRRVLGSVAVLLVAYAVVTGMPAQWTVHGQGRMLTAASETAGAVRDWDNTVNRMLRTDELRVRLERPDTQLPGRTMEQLDQYHRGVRVWGGALSRQLEGATAVSVFGTIYGDISIDTAPTLTAADGKAAIETIGGTELGPERIPELAILPLDDGSFRLVWVGIIATSDGDEVRLFIDAKTGEVVRRYSTMQRQVGSNTVGRGHGVLGDVKKIAVQASSSTYFANDMLRPPIIRTYDMAGNLSRVISFLNGTVALGTSDVASDADNDWTDTPVVDAQVNLGYTYDYFYKRFGRSGLDNADKRMLALVHPVSRSNAISYFNPYNAYIVNAFWSSGAQVMVFGDGLPSGYTYGGQVWNYLAGGLDVVAHELTHGVTNSSSNLEYRNESGALNEAFSDMMGTSVEFYFQAAGSGSLRADYLIGEDIIKAYSAGTRDGLRSMENPASYDDPDHYSRRYTGTGDNGGVHINSGIPNQAFYLAIEGGTNRTSGIRVTGVGSANREQIEKVFYRAFTQLMTSTSNFSRARATTLQAATDLYGASSAAYNAVRDAWAAVGVN